MCETQDLQFELSLTDHLKQHPPGIHTEPIDDDEPMAAIEPHADHHDDNPEVARNQCSSS